MAKYAVATTALLFFLTEAATAFTTTTRNAATLFSIPTKQHSHLMTLSSNTDTHVDATTTEQTTALISPEETKALFYSLADSTLRIDPSNGSCCRSGCSGCSYLDEKTGDFVYEEYTSPVVSAEGEKNGLVPAWIACYDHSDVGRVMSKEAHRSKWSTILFCEEDVMEVKKEMFEEIIGAACAGASDAAKIVSFTTANEEEENEDVEVYEIASASSPPSNEAMEALWGILSPTPGLPILTKSDIANSLKALSQSPNSKWGGSITYTTFSNALQEKATAIANGKWNGSNFINYESMSVEELQEIIEERDLRRIPKIKKFMIEELRFFDEHGRQGKRHPVKRTLS